ncbi:hypothetical protein [Sinorhizobium medicae]|uniref:hypothetical protein n=1 Tax=Sinorhizobium medicae TaxID=110321 RepID=UPI000C79648C|nr:hypothetical protein [Sinorhizobium medicae]MDX0423664.1 hypothetical protein [Sinorhizobium medicae]PLT96168.1 hypothetical protein BMJ32_27215 [Sinorhizobium medicae]PLU57482.1 hypothetical protein BMJ23_09235 [Sinorhizobium medicae]TWA25637.1 hypothetical protein FB006_105298 [Sinorhizobium medicae]TWA44955.1 hypothetical protein FB005_10647 [Sinorhizobium medicae]
MQAFRSKPSGIDLIPPERKSRSGAAAPRRLDCIDVEFETVAPTARRSPYPVFNDNRRAGGGPAYRTRIIRAKVSMAGRLLSAWEARLSVIPRRRFAGLVAALVLAVFAMIAGLGGDGHGETNPLAVGGAAASVETKAEG